MFIKYSEIRVCFMFSLGLHFVNHVVVTADTPMMETSETQVGITQGRTAILPCMINLDRESGFNVYWRNQNGNTLSTNTKVMEQRRKYSVSHPFPNEWNLMIEHVRDTDDGRYTCSTDTSPVHSRIVVLRVNVPPSILTSGNINVKENERLVVYCNVTGSPPPVITWFKEKKLLPDVDGEMLVIDNVQRSDAGQYSCTAENGIAQPDSETFTVDVMYVPKVTTLVSRILQYKYKDAVMECQVSANPEGKVSWFKNGNELQGNWKYLIEGYRQEDGSWSNMLTVGPLERHDFGDYVCLAVNDVGSDSSVITVIEMTTPVPKTTSEASPIKSSTSNIHSSSISYIPRSTTAPQNGNQENLVVVPDESNKSPSRDVNLITLFICFPILLVTALVLT